MLIEFIKFCNSFLKQGSVALNTHLFKEEQRDAFILGLYSVAKSLWFHRDETINLSHSQLEDILSIAKGIVYAKIDSSSSKNYPLR